MNSGIGDPKELNPFGIKALVNLPSVGKNASDHAILDVSWTVNVTNPLDAIAENMTLFDKVFTFWKRTGGAGPLGNIPLGTTHVAWQRLPKDSPAFATTPDQASGPNSPHIELIVTVTSTLTAYSEY